MWSIFATIINIPITIINMHLVVALFLHDILLQNTEFLVGKTFEDARGVMALNVVIGIVCIEYTIYRILKYIVLYIIALVNPKPKVA